LSKVAATYWDNSQVVSVRKQTRAMSARKKTSAKNSWFGFAAVASISLLLCLAINLRAFSEMRQEVNANEQLNLQIETLTTENLALQEEIQDLRKDDRAIEREARKIGMSRPNEKILVPAN
jgi:cell division protein FtsB